MHQFQHIPLLFAMVFEGLVIYYLNNLNTIGCKCAMNYKRTYILYYSIFALVYGGFTLTPFYTPQYMMRFMLVSILLVCGAVLNVIFTILYVEELKKENCTCSESVIREIMLILSIINAISWGILLLMILYISITIGTSPNLLKQIKALKSMKGKSFKLKTKSKK